LQGTLIALPPSFLIAATTISQASALRLETTTLAPACASLGDSARTDAARTGDDRRPVAEIELFHDFRILVGRPGLVIAPLMPDPPLRSTAFLMGIADRQICPVRSDDLV
jgi:hypothetical protein